MASGREFRDSLLAGRRAAGSEAARLFLKASPLPRKGCFGGVFRGFGATYWSFISALNMGLGVDSSGFSWKGNKPSPSGRMARGVPKSEGFVLGN
jgi:hypothetical protein